MDDGSLVYLSVIIPAYNEARRIGPTLEKIINFLKTRDYRSEVVVVNDGSQDDTVGVIQRFCKKNTMIRVINNERNRGKGYSVKRGILEARGHYVVFSDADLSVPIAEAECLLEALNDGFDVAVGIRGASNRKSYVAQPWHREVSGKVFYLLSNLIVPINSSDSQCGFKGYKREAAQAIFARQRVSGFAFDVENLYLAQKLGYRVKEVPVDWVDQPNSSIRLLRDAVVMMAELVQIRSNDARGMYRCQRTQIDKSK